MFTELPKDIFSEITNYYKQLGFIIVNSGYLCIHEKKFNLSQISVIQIYINESYYLEFSPKQFLYQSGEYIQLPFKQSKKKSIIFGLTFLDNLYLTINQNQKSLSFSQSDCQSSVQNSSSYKYFAFLLVFSILILFAIIIKLFKKQKQYGTVAQVQEVELQNSTIQREKEDEEEEQL
ncbi:unnamed protein product [Paramecium sonneborni]|uniref:Transmembrane protein n=1 Tax=Paramecium sonneborni TaxID=65129 RepID=A0A8S1M0R0_9CILI|nr:unnamed protein product [Paramecium sonneborni]